MYVKPLQYESVSLRGSDSTMSQLSEMLSKVDYIISISTALLADLKERASQWSDAQTLADIFIKMVCVVLRCVVLCCVVVCCVALFWVVFHLIFVCRDLF